MRDSANETELKLGDPAVYRIVLQGSLDPSAADHLAGMRIETDASQGDERSRTTTLIGRIADQPQLIGVVNTLYAMRFPILTVERLRAGEWTPVHIDGEDS